MSTTELLPCPFCGGGTTQFHENGKVWQGMKYSEPASVSVHHWCDPVAGQPHRMIERVGRDRESAVAAWNRRASQAQQPAAATISIPGTPGGDPACSATDARTSAIAGAQFDSGRLDEGSTPSPGNPQAQQPAPDGEAFERGRQQGISQERALWELARSSQEMAAKDQT